MKLSMKKERKNWKKWKLDSETPTSETREPVDKKGVKNLNIERSEHIIKILMYSKRVILSMIYYLYVFIHFHVNDSVKVKFLLKYPSFACDIKNFVVFLVMFIKFCMCYYTFFVEW